MVDKAVEVEQNVIILVRPEKYEEATDKNCCSFEEVFDVAQPETI